MIAMIATPPKYRALMRCFCGDHFRKIMDHHGSSSPHPIQFWRSWISDGDHFLHMIAMRLAHQNGRNEMHGDHGDHF